MLRLPPFTYLAPRSLPEAVRLMADHGPEATFVAGGTDLYPNMKRRQFEPKVLVGLRGLGDLVGVRGEPATGLRVGAGTTLTDVARHAAIRAHVPALAIAASLVSTPQLRNVGTIGGNLCVDPRCNYYNQSYPWRRAIGFCLKKDGDVCRLAPGSARCWAVSSSDTAPVLLSLGASVRLVGSRGERVIPLSQLFRDDGIRYLAKARDEVLAEILLPPLDGRRATYLKLRRRGSFDFPVLGVAVALCMDDGSVRAAKIALGGVASEPREAAEAGALLAGQRLTPELIDAVADVAARSAKPLDNTDLTHGYRKKMTKVFVARALRRLAGPADSTQEGGA